MFTQADVDYVNNIFTRVKLAPHTAPFLWSLESDDDSIEIDCYSIQQTEGRFVIWEEYFIPGNRWEPEAPDVREIGEAKSLGEAVEFIVLHIMRNWVRDVCEADAEARDAELTEKYWAEQDVPF